MAEFDRLITELRSNQDLLKRLQSERTAKKLPNPQIDTIVTVINNLLNKIERICPHSRVIKEEYVVWYAEYTRIQYQCECCPKSFITLPWSSRIARHLKFN